MKKLLLKSSQFLFLTLNSNLSEKILIYALNSVFANDIKDINDFNC